MINKVIVAVSVGSFVAHNWVRVLTRVNAIRLATIESRNRRAEENLLVAHIRVNRDIPWVKQASQFIGDKVVTGWWLGEEPLVPILRILGHRHA